ncbi:hypothetical protein ACFXHA_12640 [Nocardia sp. NPDC059240]|uniref:hypothetical protein n=1 Tax=Nocardia sp. NPDC059240 TaxID=3346786 RepID=UPI003683508D
MRADWREILGEISTNAETFVILKHGRPEAVLLPQRIWTQGCRILPVPDTARRYRASSDARSGLRSVRSAAVQRGEHTLIHQLYAPLFKDTTPLKIAAVVSPYTWVRQALPELGEFPTA